MHACVPPLCASYDTIRYDTIRYDTLRYDTIRYDTLRYDTIRYDTLRYPTIPYPPYLVTGGGGGDIGVARSSRPQRILCPDTQRGRQAQSTRIQVSV